ncbi:hypothetical protein Tco_0284845 [Tanacetum coccineum]
MVSDRRGETLAHSGSSMAFRVSLGRLHFDAVARALISSLANPDDVTRNPDAVSIVCKKFFKPLRIKLQSCHTSKFTAAEDLIWDCDFMA